MALRNERQEVEYGTPQGLDTTSPLPTMQEGYVRVARNCDLGLVGGYSKRQGYTNRLTGSVYGSRDIVAGIEYRPSSGVNQTVIFATDNSGSGGRLGYVSGGSVVDIVTGLSGTLRPAFAQFDTRLFFYNGSTTPLLYDGSGTRQIGITAPVSAPTLAQGTSGSLTQLGTYIYAYTYYNSVTGAESSPSPLSASTTLTGANDDFTLTIAAGDSSTADTIRIYRTVANGNILFLDGTAAIGATSYLSTVSDSGLGQQIELDNSRITDWSTSPKYPVIADNRVFVVTGDNEVRFSKIGQDGPMPESFQTTAFVPTTGGFGAYDKIVGLNKINQTPIVIKELSIGRLEPIGTQEFVATDPVQYVYREISTTVGGVAHEAACQVLGELIFVAKENIYATDGINVRPIADSIQSTIRELGFSNAQRPKMSCINDKENRRIYVSVFNGGETDPSIVLVGDYRFYPKFRWTTYEPGTNSTTHPGIKAGCFFEVTNSTSGKQDIYFGNIVANGKLYRMNDGTNDDGSPIFFRVVTRPYFFGNPLKVKLAKLAEVQAQGENASADLTIGSIFDLVGLDSDRRDIPFSTAAAVYDTAVYDTDLYTDELVESIRYDTHEKMRYWQVVFEQTEVDVPVELYAWQVLASAFDKEEV